MAVISDEGLFVVVLGESKQILVGPVVFVVFVVVHVLERVENLVLVFLVVVVDIERFCGFVPVAVVVKLIVVVARRVFCARGHLGGLDPSIEYPDRHSVVGLRLPIARLVEHLGRP